MDSKRANCPSAELISLHGTLEEIKEEGWADVDPGDVFPPLGLVGNDSVDPERVIQFPDELLLLL